VFLAQLDDLRFPLMGSIQGNDLRVRDDALRLKS
jgi:hypothetical protein